MKLKILLRRLSPIFWGLVIFWLLLTLLNSEAKNKEQKIQKVLENPRPTQNK